MITRHDPGHRLSRRRFLGATAGFAGALALSGCLPGRDAAPGVRNGPRTGGQAVITIIHPNTLNPAISPVSTDLYNTPFFFNGLTRPGDDYTPLPDLAESWTVSEDNKRFVFSLREGVRFHDGEPFTADDVKFSWELYTHPENAPGRQLGNFFSRIVGAREYMAGDAPEIAGIKILDPYTVDVTLTDVYAPFLTIAAGQMIVPKHVWQDVPVSDLGAHPAARRPVGTGPFILESWAANDSIAMRAYEEYHFGRPYLDRIISLANADAADSFSLLMAGEIDVTGLYRGVPLDSYDELAADGRFEARPLPGLANMYAEFNLRVPHFQDLRVRKALSYALDRGAISDSLWRGRASHVNGPIHPAFWASKPDTTMFDNDPSRAAELFAEAGYRQGTDGILEKDGQKLGFTMQSIMFNYDVIVQDQWRRAGVDVEVERMDFPSFWGPLYLAGRTEVAALNLPFGLYLDPDFPLTGYFHSSLNRNEYHNPRVDSVIEEATATLDREERKHLYFELQELLAQDVPHLWLGVPDEVWGIAKGLVVPQKPVGYLTIRSARDWYREDL